MAILASAADGEASLRGPRALPEQEPTVDRRQREVLLDQQRLDAIVDGDRGPPRGPAGAPHRTPHPAALIAPVRGRRPCDGAVVARPHDAEASGQAGGGG